jgi:hypothetical protein
MKNSRLWTCKFVKSTVPIAPSCTLIPSSVYIYIQYICCFVFKTNSIVHHTKTRAEKLFKISAFHTAARRPAVGQGQETTKSRALCSTVISRVEGGGEGGGEGRGKKGKREGVEERRGEMKMIKEVREGRRERAKKREGKEVSGEKKGKRKREGERLGKGGKAGEEGEGYEKGGKL